MTGVRWVCLDIGETLIDETRVWTTWAQVLDITPLVLHAAMGIAIAQGGSYPEALVRFAPDWPDRVPEFEAAFGGFTPADLYPDALDALEDLSAAGFGVAVIGNQPAPRTAQLRAIGVRPDVMAMSDELGAAKPDPAFFAAVLTALGDPAPDQVAYVGDRVDNDVTAAHACGLRTIHLRRGPWGLLGPQDDGTADAVADDLHAVVRTVTAWR
ncbi:HAD family hydrolase [Euzebya sp.]|uniref:HAD family hydrolase n=1 Tax=Euzebya sp. TaxID=1971409 RepID=UPI003517E67D